MDSTINNKPIIHAMTMAELLPGLSGICSKDASQTLTTIKQPRKTLALTRTAVKVIKPMTIAEMQAGILALKDKTPRRPAQPAAASNKKNWNSSVKLDNKFRRTTINEQMKNNPVKKALNFQSKPMAPLNQRKTIINPETPKFPKPALKAKKAIPLTRISGVCKIAETPASSRTNRVTISNKENYSFVPKLPKQTKPVTPKSILKQKLKPPIPDTPISNISWKSSDTSFLQKEKEINDIEEKTKIVAEEPTLDNLAEVSPPVSTPFKEYRNVQEFFQNSNDVSLNEDSAIYNNNTILSFDNMPISKENSKREESVIVSLCDMLNKATVNNTESISSELKDLLESEKQTKENIKTIENCINFLTRIKESYLKRQKHVQKLIQEKQSDQPSNISDKTEIKVENSKNVTTTNVETSKPCSVIKSPTYKIPKKNLCLRKKVFHKSLPNVSTTVQSPTMLDSSNVIAHNMYMKMKENMNFLNTPSKMRNNEIPDTPAITSRNLQNQLDKLYNGS